MLRVVLVALLFALLIRALWRIVGSGIAAAGARQPRHRGGDRAVKLVRDPVCGTYVPPRTALSLTAGGSTHYFCSEQCKTAFHART